MGHLRYPYHLECRDFVDHTAWSESNLCHSNFFPMKFVVQTPLMKHTFYFCQVVSVMSREKNSCDYSC